jgi:NADPH-dependent ferric siderophore reductase
MTLIAEARARARAPERLITQFRDHMAEHGLKVSGPAADCRIHYPGVTALLRLRDGEIDLRIEASTADNLADAKNSVSGHLDAFAPGEALGIVWTGDGAVTNPDARPHNFRTARVVGSRDVTPRMRRVTLRGEGLERFDAEHQHIKILIPEGSGEPVWPRVSPSGMALFDECSLTRRTYTVRRLNLAAGELDIEFVLHGDASPGSRFALQAQPGDWLGLMGPGGGGIKAEGWTLLAGDETALPAIGRSLEGMAPDARGLALIEVADAAEEQDFAHPPGFAIRWLHRNGASYGASLLEAVRAAGWPEGEAVSAWAACENATAAAIREHWIQEGRLQRGRFRAVGYWRQGAGEEEEH